jgi:hypothetical protein
LKRLAIVAAALVFMVVAIGGMIFVLSQPRARIVATEVTFETLTPTHKAIRIRGTAHYRGVVHQKVPASIISDAKEFWVYALFPVNDTEGREVKVLVRSETKPPSRVDFEFVVLEGWVDPPKAHTVPMFTQQMMSRSGYFWDDLLVLTPWESKGFDPADE